MKVVKNKFLLLSIIVGIAFSSCNTNSGFLAKMFGFQAPNIVKPTNIERLKSFGLKAYDCLETPFFAAAIAVIAYFSIDYFFTRSNPTQPPAPGPALAPAAINNKNVVDKVWKLLPVVEGSQAGAQKGDSEQTTDVEGCKVGAQVGNFAQNRVAQVVQLARLNNILMNDGIVFKVKLSNEKVAKNTMYQLSVHQQQDLSCGPRALYNSNFVSQVFDNNNGVFVNDINLLADLNSLSGYNENPKLRQFFIEMNNNHVAARNIQWTEICPEYINKTEYEEKDGKKIEKVTKVKNPDPRAGFKDPQNLYDADLEAFLDYCKPENNMQVKIKNTDIMSGYTECFAEEVGSRVSDLMGHENLVGFLNAKDIGYFHSFVINNGQHEGRGIGHNSGGHWVSIVVIKTGENEYSWFALDSMNGNLLNSSRMNAYIYKLLGSVYQEYEDTIINPAKRNIAERQEGIIFREIKNRIDCLKLLNKDRVGKDSKVNLSLEVANLVRATRNIERLSMYENFIYFLYEEVKAINRLNLLGAKIKEDLIKEIFDFMESDNLEISDNFADDNFVVHSNAQVAAIKTKVNAKERLNESMKNSILNAIGFAVDISEGNNAEKAQNVDVKTKESEQKHENKMEITPNQKPEEGEFEEFEFEEFGFEEGEFEEGEFEEFGFEE